MADSISRAGFEASPSPGPSLPLGGRVSNDAREAVPEHSPIRPGEPLTAEQAGDINDYCNAALSHIESLRYPSLPSLSGPGAKINDKEESAQAGQPQAAPSTQPSGGSSPSRTEGTPFAENPNKDLIPSLLGGNSQTRSIVPEKWRKPISKTDLTELSKALPPGTPATIAISNVHAIPAKNVDLEKLRAFSDAGRLTGFTMYNGKVPFKRAEPPSGPKVKLVGKGLTPDLPVQSTVTESGGAIELKLTNTEKLKSFGSTVVENGQYALRVVMIPYSDKEGGDPTHYLVYTVGGGNIQGHEKEFTGLTEDLSRWITSQVRK